MATQPTLISLIFNDLNVLSKRRRSETVPKQLGETSPKIIKKPAGCLLSRILRPPKRLLYLSPCCGEELHGSTGHGFGHSFGTGEPTGAGAKDSPADGILMDWKVGFIVLHPNFMMLFGSFVTRYFVGSGMTSCFLPDVKSGQHFS